MPEPFAPSTETIQALAAKLREDRKYTQSNLVLSLVWERDRLRQRVHDMRELSRSSKVESSADWLAGAGLDEAALAALLEKRGIESEEWKAFAQWPIIGSDWQPEERDTGTAPGWCECEFVGAPMWAQNVLDMIGGETKDDILASIAEPERGE